MLSLSFSFSRFLSIRLSLFSVPPRPTPPSPFNSRASRFFLASFSVLLLNHSRSVASLSGRSPFPFLSLARLLTRSFVATAVASDTVSNGSGGHTILRLNSTDTAAQRRSFSSYSFPLSLSFSSFSSFSSATSSSFSLSCSPPPFAAPSDHTPPYSFFPPDSSGNPHDNTLVLVREGSLRGSPARDLTMENVDYARPLIFYGNATGRWLKRE